MNTRDARRKKKTSFVALTEQTNSARYELSLRLERLATEATRQAERVGLGAPYEPNRIENRLTAVLDCQRILAATLRGFEATNMQGPNYVEPNYPPRRHGIITGSHVDRDTT